MGSSTSGIDRQAWASCDDCCTHVSTSAGEREEKAIYIHAPHMSVPPDVENRFIFPPNARCDHSNNGVVSTAPVQPMV